MKAKKIKNTPARIDHNDLILASAAGDSAADNLLDMIDEGSLNPNDVARIAELYNSTNLSE